MEVDTQETQKDVDQGDWDAEEDHDEDEDQDEDDEDIDKEAQEIARRLGEQLWADISKVNAERSAAAAAATSAVVAVDSAFQASLASDQNKRKEEVVISTMTSILTLVEKDPQAKAVMLSATIPDGTNVLDLLYRCTATRHIGRGVAGPLSQLVVSLAKSEVLFGNLRRSNAAALQLNIGKRKRDELLDDDQSQRPPHPHKRPYIPDDALHRQVVEAVRVVSQTLGGPPSAQALDPSRVSSVRLELHQVFLFAVTSAAVAGPNVHALQEIGGLIQVVGVLSGTQIGHAPSDSTTTTNLIGASSPSLPIGHHHHHQPPSAMTDIGTAVYPCLVAGCGMTFSRLYGLRAHQRSHAAHRPYRCELCPASFARNHDLKRHAKLHDRKAWECQGCRKVFSRRDAIKRHKNAIVRNRGARNDACLTAEVVEVQLEDAEADAALRDERRAKLWTGIAVTEATTTTTTAAGTSVDLSQAEGRIDPAVILSIQTSILGLHPLLHALVGDALGHSQGRRRHPGASSSSSPPVESSSSSSAGQATLAGIIARAQSQSLPHPLTSSSRELPDPSSMDAPSPDASTAGATALGPATADARRPLPTLSMYGLSDEQMRLLEIAVANAASAALAQAEVDAALEEEQEGGDNNNNDDDDDDDEEEEENLDSDMEQDKP